MYALPEYPLQVAADLKIPSGDFALLEASEGETTLASILTEFTNGGAANADKQWFWNDLLPTAFSCMNKTPTTTQPLLALGQAGDAVFLVLEDATRRDRRANYWVFKATLQAAVSVLSDLHTQEFYLIDQELSWLFAENHHDMWFVLGDQAVAAVQTIRSP